MSFEFGLKTGIDILDASPNCLQASGSSARACAAKSRGRKKIPIETSARNGTKAKGGRRLTPVRPLTTVELLFTLIADRS
jgi:hypothetical protein